MSPDFKSAIAALLVFASLAGATEAPGGEPVGDEGMPLGPDRVEQGPSAIDNDPTVHEYEVRAPSLDSTSPAWVPSYEWHSGEEGAGKGADSLVCGDRRACLDYKATAANETKEAAPK